MNVHMTDDLLDRLSGVLLEKDVPDLEDIRARFIIILDDFKVEPKETALAVWTEGKNEWFLQKFLLAKAVAGLSKNTLNDYRKEISKALEAMGKDADAVTSEDVQVYLARTMQRASKRYAENARLDLSSFFGWLHREELISKNPMYRVEKIKVQKQKKPAFTEMDVELIRAACRTNRERAIVEMLLSTGCRVSELVSVRIDDIDGDSINILGKGDKYRNVYLNAKASLALRLYLEERKDPNPYLFPRCAATPADKDGLWKLVASKQAEWYKDPRLVEETGTPDKSVIETIVRQLGKRAGVEKCHPHRFRRTCATFALRRGMPIEQVSKMLGHANIATTQVYLDLSEEELAQAHRKYVV